MKITIEVDAEEITRYQKSLFDASFPMMGKYNDYATKTFLSLTESMQEQTNNFIKSIYGSNDGSK